VLSIQAAQSVQVFQSIQKGHFVQVLPSKLRNLTSAARDRSRIACTSDATGGEFATKYLAAGMALSSTGLPAPGRPSRLLIFRTEQLQLRRRPASLLRAEQSCTQL